MEEAYVKVKNAASSHSIDDLWAILQNDLESGIKAYIPHKATKRKDRLPWLNRNIIRLMRKRDKAYIKLKQNQHPDQVKKYRDLKHLIQKESRQAHWQYLDGLFTSVEENGTFKFKRLWSYIKHAKKDSTGTTQLKEGSNVHSDSKDKANILNGQFQSVFSKRKPLTLHQTTQRVLTQHNITGPNTTPSFPPMEEITVNKEGVRKLFVKLDPYKAAGPDRIQSRVLKELADTMSKSLTIIYNKSLASGSLPLIWKHAEVAPIYKKGDRTTASNYRPISLTCIACKTLEHIIVSNIMRHADHHNILYPLQHGFRSKRSCTAQFIAFIDLSRQMESGVQSDVIVMDFSKAFDKVSHNKLCHKLHHYGIGGTTNRWIQNFLEGRTQCVVLEGASSNKVPVLSGVPQGSVLGPSLFLFYINDLPEGLTSTVRLFADDTILYLGMRGRRGSKALQSDLDKLAAWELRWDMQFHPGKCQVISVTRSHKPTIHTYTLNGKPLDHVDSAKYLGVMVTSNLNWNQHVSTITAKTNKTLGFVRRNLRVSSKNVKETAYQTLVRPIVKYASPVWDPHQAYLIHKLEMVQRTAARYVSSRWHNTSSVSDMLTTLGWRSLQARRMDAKMNMFYKMRHNLAIIPTVFNITPATRSLRHSNTQSYIIPSARCDYYHHSFFPSSIRNWNLLPQIVVDSPCLETFKQRVQSVNYNF